VTSKTTLTRGWLGKLTLLAGSLAVALALAELTLRLVSPGYSPLFLDIYREDGHGLILLEPNLRRKHVTAEWRVTVETNADGLRDRTAPLPDSGGRVLGLGDSFAFGWGVEFEEAFLTRAEGRLRPRAVRIVKAGLPGTGPTDYASFLAAYGERYDPDLVLVAVFVGNDFADALMGGVGGQFTVRNGLMLKREPEGEEARRPPLLRRAREWLKSSSLLAQQGAQALWFLEQTFLAPEDRGNPGLTARDRWLWEFAKVHLRLPPEETLRSFEMTTAALNAIAEWCSLHDARMALVVIPRGMQIYQWERARWQEAYRLTDQDLDLDRPQRILTMWAQNRAVPVLDLLPAFRAAAAREDEPRLFYYPNSHMNAHGHAVAGGLIAEFLTGLLAPREDAPR